MSDQPIAASEVITLSAPAKLTLSLKVTGVRSDGLHLIDAEMVTLDFGDTLELRPGPTSLHVVSDDAAVDAARWVSRDTDNTVVRALELVDRSAEVRLIKRIPAQAGLGGGSADAAAILRWAGVDDPNVAATLGADVAFCLLGGRASVSGIGDVLKPLPHRSQTFTLFTPPIGCSTAVVYRKWDELGGPEGDNGNDLEPAALEAYPELLRWRDKFGEDVGSRPRLAGSGSTWFVEGSYPGESRVVTQTIQSTREPEA